MAFFGMFNYARPGKGVSKNAPEKKRFFEFFDIYFRNFGRMLKLHFIHLLFCIPIVTIGPANVALVKILHCFQREKPVFLFSDFLDEFKKNFKQGFWLGIINTALGIIIFMGLWFYFINLGRGLLMYVAMGMLLLVLIVYTFSTYYSYLLVALVNMKLYHIIKNSFLLSFLGTLTNFLTLIFTIVLSIPAVIVFAYAGPLALLVLPTVSKYMLGTFNGFEQVYRYVIKPYYDMTGEENPYEPADEDDEMMIFEDASDTETIVTPQKSSGKSSGKTIS